MSDISPQERQPKERPIAAAVGYRIDELPIRRTHAYQLIKDKKLRAKKSGRCTIVPPGAWEEYLASCPDLETSAA